MAEVSLEKMKKEELLERALAKIQELKSIDSNIKAEYEVLKTRIKVLVKYEDVEYVIMRYKVYKKAYRSKSKSKKYLERVIEESKIIIIDKVYNKSKKELIELIRDIDNIKNYIDSIKKEYYKEIENKIAKIVEEEIIEYSKRVEVRRMCREFREALRNKDLEKIKYYLSLVRSYIDYRYDKEYAEVDSKLDEIYREAMYNRENKDLYEKLMNWYKELLYARDKIIDELESYRCFYNKLKEYVKEILIEKNLMNRNSIIAILDCKSKYVLVVESDYYKYEKYATSIDIFRYNIYLIDIINREVIEIEDDDENMSVKSLSDFYKIKIEDVIEKVI